MMCPTDNTICIDHKYATTRRLLYSKAALHNLPETKYLGQVFGGLRARGYYKQSTLDTPLISIITVVLNGGNILEATIQSVIQQSYDNIEYIVLDGGSTDNSLEIIKKYESFIDIWISGKDRGVYDAMNRGAQLACGEWLNFMNAGDRLLHLDPASLRNTTTTCYYFDEQKEKILRRPFTKLFLCRNNPCHQSVFYRKKEFRPYDLQYAVIADFEQWTRIVRRVIKPVFNNSIVYYATPGISNIPSKIPLRNLCKNIKIRLNIIRRNMGVGYFLIGAFHSVRVVATFVIRRKIIYK